MTRDNFPESQKLSTAARRYIPGGVNSNVRLDGPPLFFSRGEGAWLWDVDGNDYVDYLLGQGPAFLGHAPADIVTAVEEASRLGMVYGAQHPLEVEAADRMCEVLEWPEMIRFGSSGTEMVQAALRLARAATGRHKFIRFEGHYHGWLDNVLVNVGDEGASTASAGQLASHIEDGILLPWNDLDTLSAALQQRGPEVAAVLMEPMMINAGAIEPEPGYLEAARRLCDSHGVMLIFDEIITGFRIAPGGASERYDVIPDMATYGKAMAGSWPVAAIAGSRELMEPFGTGEVNHSGTFNANVMGMAAVTATLRRLADNPPYEQLERVGTTLMEGLRKLGEASGLPLHVQGLPMAFHLSFGDGAVTDYRSLQMRDADRYRRLADALIAEGIWVARRGIWYVSAAHGDEEVEVTLERAEAAMGRI